jgi:HEAT repeat protein
MKVTCPSCQVVIRLANGPEGKNTITCPKCQARVSLGFKEPPAAPPRRSRRDRRYDILADDTRDASTLFGEELWGSIALVGVGFVLMGLCFVGLGTAVVCLWIMGALAFILGLWAGIWFLIIAFQEDAMQGILCLFVPFYGLYYLISRFGSTYRTLLPHGGSIVLILLMVIGVIIAGVGKAKELQQDRAADAGRWDRPEVTKHQAVEPPKTFGVNSNAPGFIDLALQDLQSNNAEHRVHAASKLAEMSPTARQREVAQALATAASDPAQHVRFYAIKALCVWGGPEHTDLMLKMLKDKDQGCVQEASRFFLKHPDERALEPLLEWLPRLRDDVRAVLLKHGEKAERAVIAAAKRGSVEQRRVVLEYLSETGAKEALAVMLDALRDSEHSIRDSAIAFFKRNRAPESVDGLAALLESHRDAADALRHQGPAAEKAALAIAQRSDSRSRREALELLRDLGTKESVPALRGLLAKRDHDKDRVADALRSIAQRNPKDFPADKPPIWEIAPIDQALADLMEDNLFQKRDAVRALAKHDPGERKAEVLKAIEPLLDDRDTTLRRDAIAVLGNWGGAEGVARLIRIIDDQDLGVREVVIVSLGKSKDERAIPAIASRLPDFFDRKHAVKALKDIGTPAQKEVSKYLLHNDAGVRLEACKIIGEIGDKEAILAMTNLSKQTKDRALAQEAAKALAQIKARTMGEP